MAQKVQVILVDDIDGGSADETVSFALDGVAYEIDLSAKNACRVPGLIRAVRRPPARSAAGRAAAVGLAVKGGDNRTAQIREWARSNGHKVNRRGRIPATVVEAYDKAHP